MAKRTQEEASPRQLNDYQRKLEEMRVTAESLQSELGPNFTVTVRQAYPKVHLEVRPKPVEQ